MAGGWATGHDRQAATMSLQCGKRLKTARCGLILYQDVRLVRVVHQCGYLPRGEVK